MMILYQANCQKKNENNNPATQTPLVEIPPSTEPTPTSHTPPKANSSNSNTASKAKTQPPRIALVIDDLGQAESSLVSRVCSLKVPITVAVLPFLSHTKENASLANTKGAEIILHMPMEPLGYPGPGKHPGEGAIFYSQTETEVRQNIARAMDNIPYAKGMNNHMGSRITPDRDRMAWILEEAKARKWYFLDSRTEKDTIGLEVARELGIPALERKIFLDDDPNPTEMHKQWERAMSLARQDGRVVIIGHIHPETVSFLEKVLPKASLEATFVKASALAR
ncbi:MAG: divergent polysaccharide deacetylase family protein [Holophagaceae bacterium]|nr:divergent polysaccharide deacetylase family protein [Holophagaceae bacterium]